MRKTIPFLFACLVTFSSVTAGSATPIEHPVYLRALANLRAARWLIDHHPDKSWVQSKDEASAVMEMDAAISEIKHAAIDDHKDVKAHVNAQEGNDRLGRLHAALELLKKTRAEIEKKEDEHFANGLQIRVFQHLDVAILAIERAIGTK